MRCWLCFQELSPNTHKRYLLCVVDLTPLHHSNQNWVLLSPFGGVCWARKALIFSFKLQGKGAMLWDGIFLTLKVAAWRALSERRQSGPVSLSNFVFQIFSKWKGSTQHACGCCSFSHILVGQENFCWRKEIHWEKHARWLTGLLTICCRCPSPCARRQCECFISLSVPLSERMWVSLPQVLVLYFNLFLLRLSFADERELKFNPCNGVMRNAQEQIHIEGKGLQPLAQQWLHVSYMTFLTMYDDPAHRPRLFWQEDSDIKLLFRFSFDESWQHVQRKDQILGKVGNCMSSTRFQLLLSASTFRCRNRKPEIKDFSYQG